MLEKKKKKKKKKQCNRLQLFYPKEIMPAQANDILKDIESIPIALNLNHKHCFVRCHIGDECRHYMILCKFCELFSSETDNCRGLHNPIQTSGGVKKDFEARCSLLKKDCNSKHNSELDLIYAQECKNTKKHNYSLQDLAIKTCYEKIYTTVGFCEYGDFHPSDDDNE